MWIIDFSLVPVLLWQTNSFAIKKWHNFNMLSETVYTCSISFKTTRINCSKTWLEEKGAKEKAYFYKNGNTSDIYKNIYNLEDCNYGTIFT